MTTIFTSTLEPRRAARETTLTDTTTLTCPTVAVRLSIITSMAIPATSLTSSTRVRPSTPTTTNKSPTKRKSMPLTTRLTIATRLNHTWRPTKFPPCKNISSSKPYLTTISDKSSNYMPIPTKFIEYLSRIIKSIKWISVFCFLFTSFSWRLWSSGTKHFIHHN